MNTDAYALILRADTPGESDPTAADWLDLPTRDYGTVNLADRLAAIDGGTFQNPDPSDPW